MKACANIALLLTILTIDCLISRGQSVSGIVNTYYQVTAVNSAANTLTVSDATGLIAGQRVLVYQAKGATFTIGNVAGFGDITALNTAGGYEFNTICSLHGNDVLLRDQFVNTYSAAGQVQLVTIPSYSSVTISGTVTGKSWDPVSGTGGIVVLEASGTITLNADINVSGFGFQGGALVNWPTPSFDCSWADNVTNYFLPLQVSGNFTGGRKGEGIGAYVTGEEFGRGKLVNGGGGGNNANTGGGGGGNVGAGGVGGKRSGETTFQCHGANAGVGGVSLATYGYSTGSNRIYFGGGGGSGHENNAVGTPGGNGGGIIILSASTIVGGGGSLYASGRIPSNAANIEDTIQAQGDGGGGGGAGGAILLNAATITGAIVAEAKGAKGSDASFRVNDCTGPGGGGGGGIVWVAGSSFPGAVSATVTGGANGIVSLGNTKVSCTGAANGAASGAAGAAQAGYVAPASVGTTCTVLALDDLKYFTVVQASPGGAAGVAGDILLSWEVSSAAVGADIRHFVVQRSFNAINFIAIGTLSSSPDSIIYHYKDAAGNVDGALYYRLVWQHMDGSWDYSRIVPVSAGPAPVNFSFRLQPNPALNNLTLTIFSTNETYATATIASAQGQVIQTLHVTLHKGANVVPVSLVALAPATYFFIVDEDGRRLVKSFVKRGE